MTRSERRGFTLGDAAREFWKHPSPWMIGVTLLAALTARIVVGDWRLSDALLPVALLVVVPFVEWMIHVFVLHWRPRRLGSITLDSLLARKHREHHADPRDVPLIFIPWRVLIGGLPVAVAVAVLLVPRTGLGLTFLVFVTVVGLSYEWCHYLIHTDYKPKTVCYRSIWRNHRQHHFKNEHYWFTVTSTGTADRVLGTYPEPTAVTASPTAKNLHAAATPGR